MMKTLTFATAMMATGATALSVAPDTCIVNLRGTSFNQLALRPTPCNNKAPIVMLAHGTPLFLTTYKQTYGCGFMYNAVAYTAPNGYAYYGFVGADYVTCHYVSPTPNPANPAPASQQQCGNWSVENGGPVNACGKGYDYIAGDNTYCSAGGSDCQSICCSQPILN